MANRRKQWRTVTLISPFINKLDELDGIVRRALTAGLLTAGLALVLTACGGGSGSGGSNNGQVPTPGISNFSPPSGSAGTTVTINGTHLNGATSVKFNGTAAASFAITSSTQITATVANGTTTGAITVTTPGGMAVSPGNFSILGPPTITSFNPPSGPVGTTVTITGTNFTGTTAVSFNGHAATTFTVNSVSQITASVASGTTTGPISVTTPMGTANSSTNFTVTTTVPVVTSFNPTSGPVGTPVTINGSNFTGATAVAFNGTPSSSFIVNSAIQITATVANGTTTGKISVTGPGGTGTSANNFTVISSSGLDLTIDGLYVTQATQEYPNPSVPLVANRSAWVRVFVVANQANSVTPQVKVDFIKGSATNSLTINAGSSSVPLSADPTNAATSWNAAVPAAWMQPGTQVVATVDPTNAVTETSETNNTATVNLDVHTLKTWKVTLLPVHTGDGLQGVVEGGSRTRQDWLDMARRLHPVPDTIDVAVGSVLNSSVTTLTNSGGGWSTVLNEVDAKRTADGATDRYYFGAVHTNYNSGVAGLGFVGWPAAIGWDVSGSFPTVFAHEEGHNFNRPHSPCGGASNPDPNYPYPGAEIGVPGWDAFAGSNNLKSATGYVDVMSYCSPVWVSDYVYKLVLSYRESSPIGIIVNAADRVNGPAEGLLVWGRIENGTMVLEPAFRLPSTGVPVEGGPFTWEACDGAGRVLASMSFKAHEVADLPDGSTQVFSFIVPLKAEVLQAIQSMHVKSDGQERAARTISAAPMDAQSAVQMQDLPDGQMQVTWDGERNPVLMLRDAKTGEVRGFLRGGNAVVESAPGESEIRFSDRIRGEVVRHARIQE